MADRATSRVGAAGAVGTVDGVAQDPSEALRLNKARGVPQLTWLAMNESFPTLCATILWRRLDQPGHDTAMLMQTAGGWQLSGVAVLAESDRPCRLEYEINCDSHWLTRRCSIHGYLGTNAVALEIERSGSGEWTVGGDLLATLTGCDDIDLGFSPATNLLPIRRLGLDVGATAVVRAAWVRFPELATELLEQAYTRLTADHYLYESAGGAFRRELIVDRTGFVSDYPGLWRAEATASYLDPVS